MDPIGEKREAFSNAERLLKSTAPGDLRYAALELRRSLEAIVYEKLWAYRRRLPEDIARTWQPPQAFSALAQIEPEAQHSTTISVAAQSERGVPAPGPYAVVGRDLRPGARWLRDAWNKLGSFLHAGHPFTKRKTGDEQENRLYLTAVAEKLRPFVVRTFTSNMAVCVSFDCPRCGKSVIANLMGVRESRQARCLNRSCGTEFDAVFSDAVETPQFIERVERAVCPDCGAEIVVPRREAKVGEEFSCGACHARFRFDLCFSRRGTEEGQDDSAPAAPAGG